MSDLLIAMWDWVDCDRNTQLMVCEERKKLFFRSQRAGEASGEKGRSIRRQKQFTAHKQVKKGGG